MNTRLDSTYRAAALMIALLLGVIWWVGACDVAAALVRIIARACG
jgi:hypothetical protein